MVDCIILINTFLIGCIIYTLEKHRRVFNIYGEAINAIIETKVNDNKNTSSNS